MIKKIVSGIVVTFFTLIYFEIINLLPEGTYPLYRISGIIIAVCVYQEIIKPKKMKIKKTKLP